MKICYRWGSCNIKWSNANWTWSECRLVEELISDYSKYGVDATTLATPWNPYKTDLEKKKRLIRLICKVKGEQFDESKEIKDFDVKISDVKLVIKTVTNIDLDLKLEK